MNAEYFFQRYVFFDFLHVRVYPIKRVFNVLFIIHDTIRTAVDGVQQKLTDERVTDNRGFICIRNNDKTL